MKRVNFENGKITQNILGVAMPMLVAQLISLLYNVIDRIYIARILMWAPLLSAESVSVSRSPS